MSFLKAVLALFLSFFTALFSGPQHVTQPVTKESFTYLEYPAEAIIELRDVGLTTSTFTQRADDDGDELYVNAQGYQDINGIINSPYFIVQYISLFVQNYKMFFTKTNKCAI